MTAAAAIDPTSATTTSLSATTVRRADRATPVRPRRRRDGLTGPAARPMRFAPAPGARIPAVAGPHACEAEPAVAFAPRIAQPTWRLTERGIAVALVAMAMIVVAALTVIGLTALRVTGESYTPPGQSSLSQAQLTPTSR